MTATQFAPSKTTEYHENQIVAPSSLSNDAGQAEGALLSAVEDDVDVEVDHKKWVPPKGITDRKHDRDDHQAMDLLSKVNVMHGFDGGGSMPAVEAGVVADLTPPSASFPMFHRMYHMQAPPLPNNPPYVITVIDAVSFPAAIRIIQTKCICIRRFIFTPEHLLVQPSSDIDIIDVIQSPIVVTHTRKNDQNDNVNDNESENEKENENESATMAMPLTAAFRILAALVSFAHHHQYLPKAIVNIFSTDPLIHYVARELLCLGLNLEIINSV